VHPELPQAPLLPQSEVAGQHGVAVTQVRIGNAQFHGAFPGRHGTAGVAAFERDGPGGGEDLARGGPFAPVVAHGCARKCAFDVAHHLGQRVGQSSCHLAAERRSGDAVSGHRFGSAAIRCV
jgi:hypothetical protein